MCVDAGDEFERGVEDDYRRRRAAAPNGSDGETAGAPQVKLYDRAAGNDVDVTLNWRTAPDVVKKYDKLEYTRKWTIFFRDNYRAARNAVTR